MNKWLILAIIATLLSTAYWLAFVLNGYNIFHMYWDLGIYSYDFFYHVNYASTMGGLQYLSFGNHIAPDQLLILPIYALFQSPITLLVVQALTISLTAFFLFYLVKDLIKDSRIAFALCLAYILNPGLHGILVFDYHVEFLIVPTILMAFYFYMKGKRLWCLVSFGLLLGTMEFGPAMGLVLGLGLFVYELRYNKKWSNMALAMVLVSIICLGLYYLGQQYLIQAYNANLYPNLPVVLQVYNTFHNSANINALSAFGSDNFLVFGSLNYGVYGLLIMFLSFGITAFIFVPDIAIILILPWFIETYIFSLTIFSRIWYHYYSFLIGNLAIATILSYKVMIEKGSKFISFSLKLLLVMLLVFLITYPIMVYSKNVNELPAQFLFLHLPSHQQELDQLKYVMGFVPSNASIVTNQYIAVHFTNRQYVAVMGYRNTTTFKPQYILADFNTNLSLNAGAGGQAEAFNALIATGNYSIMIKNGSAELWELGKKPAKM